MLTHETLRELAIAEPKRLVISVYALTDPRQPANTSGTPAWLINLRNGLRAISDRLEAGDDRADRLGFRALRTRIEQELIDLDPGKRARSVAWMLDGDGYSDRFSLRLPLRGDSVVADAKPFVSPLVDIADRGARTGVILVGGDVVRLVQIEQAEATEPENPSYQLSLGDWRPFGGTGGGSPARGLRTISHQENYEARVEAQRDQLFDAAATQTGKRLESLGWERIVLVSERQVAGRFREMLPVTVTDRVIAEADLNLVAEEPTAIADAIAPLIEAAWLTRTTAVVAQADDLARAGGPATLGAQETFGALAEGRVDHLVLDPEHDFSSAVGMVPPALDGPGELLGERAVEAAIGTSAHVTALRTAASETLRDAGGMVALLRY
jgi:hypothetical protein